MSATGESGCRPQPVRVGVMLDSLIVPAWVAAVVDQLLESRSVDLRLVVLNGERRKRRNP